MRAMVEPIMDPTDVYNACVAGIKDDALKGRVNGAGADILAVAQRYTALAANGNLYKYPINDRKNDEVIVGAVTKKEVKSLYSYYMVDNGMPARVFYNALIASAPNGICPLCGAGYAITLDHYLPKSKFPFFSILPCNLVPACRDCNTGKSSAVALSAAEQSLHPYYDHGSFVSDQWLFAEIKHSIPPSVRYYAKAPGAWSPTDQLRVVSHFESLKLGARFSVLAANELASLRTLLIDFVAPVGQAAIQQHLRARAMSETAIHKNSWKAAMFQALSNDPWYCETGFCL
ncbi:HNH endonuclease [Telluria sp. B2]